MAAPMAPYGGLPYPAPHPPLAMVPTARSKGLYTATLILGCIGGICGVIGGFITIHIAQVGEAVNKAPDAQTALTATEAHTVAGLGYLEILVALVAAGLAIVIGMSKGSRLLLSGVLTGLAVVIFICSGFFVGPIILAAGICGLIGSGRS
jgi:hypothetical protein